MKDQKTEGTGGKNSVLGGVSLSQVRRLSSQVPKMNHLM